MITMVQQKRNLVLTLVKQRQICLGLHYNGDESYVYGNKTEIDKFKVSDHASWYNFC